MTARKQCSHNDTTVLTFVNNPKEIFRLKTCHKCDRHWVSTEYIEEITLEELHKMITKKSAI